MGAFPSTFEASSEDIKTLLESYHHMKIHYTINRAKFKREISCSEELDNLIEQCKGHAVKVKYWPKTGFPEDISKLIKGSSYLHIHYTVDGVRKKEIVTPEGLDDLIKQCRGRAVRVTWKE